ncbi:MAG: hypothetical protein Q9181_005783, partial [Wetmoreana brouardii]
MAFRGSFDMPRSALLERGRTSLEEVREDVRHLTAVVTSAVRSRASNHDLIRSLFHLGRGERHTEENRRPLTAASQSPFAPPSNERRQQRFDSPISMQQFRYTPPGQPRRRRRETFFVENRDPMREEEYPSVSTMESAIQKSTDERLLGADRTYVEAASESIGSQHSELGHHVGPSPVATPDRTETSNGSRVHGNGTRYQPPTVVDDAPDWHYDAEGYLDQTLGQRSTSYNLPPSLQARPVPPEPQPRQPHFRPRDETERRRGRVFDSVTDYTTDPPSTVPSVQS